MSCRECRALQWKNKPWDFKSNPPKRILERHFIHLHSCIVYATNYLIFILKQLSSTQMPLSSRHTAAIVVISKHRLIRKNHLFQNKHLFSMLFSQIVLEHESLLKDCASAQGTILPMAISWKKKQMKWIMSNQEFNPMLRHFIRTYSNWKDPTQYIYMFNAIVITKGVRYGRYTGFDSDEDRQRAIELKPVASRAKTIVNVKEYMQINCGNIKCNKNYMLDKYGIDPNISINDPDLSSKHPLNLWRKREAIRKWYICKGCKNIYYCSRKCQKLSWNRDGHRRQCKQLQKLTI